MAKRAILIAGPTASGKSMLALDMAKSRNGVIINADSMQVYAVLDQISARPRQEALDQVKHYLYGFVSPAQRFSTGAWLRAVSLLLEGPELAGRLPIFVGGTGLYFEALTKGFTCVPEVPRAIVEEVSAEILPLNREQRQRVLAQADPEMAAQLKEADPQRLIRALSVLRATGRSLAQWQTEEQAGLLAGFELEKILLNPVRELLNSRIAARFEHMLATGAVGEVKQLLELDLDPALPAMKAIGVREITCWQGGEMSREEAIEKAVIATRQYAKRQRTWFRKHMADWELRFC